jgi:hypothetical protein
LSRFEKKSEEARRTQVGPNGDGRNGATGQVAQLPSGYDIILAHFKETYRPAFRRGEVIYSEALAREVKRTEACAAPGIDLVNKLEGAGDAPRNQYGVMRNDLPRFFATWAKTCWVDLVAGLPEEALGEEVSNAARDDFRDLMVSLLRRYMTFGRKEADSQAIRQERRTLIDWARLFAKPGQWQDIRGLALWVKAVDSKPRVALNHQLFSQTTTNYLLPGGHRHFADLAERYDVGVRIRAGGQRAVELTEEFIAFVLDKPQDVDGTLDGRGAHTRA